MKSNRQSPRLDAELSADAIAEALDWSNSAVRLLRTFAWFTSSSRKGTSPSDSSVLARASRAASSDSAGHDADAVKSPGSCVLSVEADTLVASFPSTSAL